MSKAARAERGRFIHDGPKFFQTSVVLYVRFESAALRQMFAYLREKESLFQRDITNETDERKLAVLKCRLYEVETQLIWMVSNLR